MLECMRSQHKHCGVFNLPVSYINYLAARKFMGSSALAPLRKIGQVAGAAGSRDQHKPLMLLHLNFEPRKPLVSKFTGDIAREPQAQCLAAISLSRHHPQIISTTLDHWHQMAKNLL